MAPFLAPSPHGAAPVYPQPEDGRAELPPGTDEDPMGRDAVDAALERQPAAPVEVAPPPVQSEEPAVEAPPADPAIDQPNEAGGGSDTAVEDRWNEGVDGGPPPAPPALRARTGQRPEEPADPVGAVIRDSQR